MLLRLEKKGLIERTGFHWRLKPLSYFIRENNSNLLLYLVYRTEINKTAPINI